MTLRPLSTLSQVRARAATRGTTLSQIETEIIEEAATSLGHYGRIAEEALARLEKAGTAQRQELLQKATDAVWAFLVQRELCGLRDHRFIIREMTIPKAVLNRMGAVKHSSRKTSRAAG